ncbi:MAG: helix-turn-helix transcriptional regulator, partial [Ruminiclostridium sp.]
EAQIAVRNKLFTGYKSVIHIEDIQDSKHISYYLILERKKELIECIETCDIETINRKLTELYSILKNDGIGNIDTAKVFSLELALSIKQFALEKSESAEEFVMSLNEFYKEVIACETLTDMMNRIGIMIYNIVDYLNLKRQSRHHKMIEKARIFINTNYRRDISIEEVAEYINISQSYFSQLFKQYIGENFLQYLTNYRLEAAKKLLIQQDLKVYEVACKVGFNDVKYFDKVFRKIVGVTPSEYKDTVNH